MKVAVFHGSPRKGNTFKATNIFMNEMKQQGEVEFTEFFLPEALPKFCLGCQLCLSGQKCPHSEYVSPILSAILESNALIFTTPHHGASLMSAAMKNLLDHLDFLIMLVAPRKEIFSKKAFIITTGTGSTAAIKPITKFLKNWGINRVNSFGIKMFIDKWDKMPNAKREKLDKILRKKARKFYKLKKKRPYISTIFMYNIFKFIMKKYIGEGAYPYEYWKENGYLKKRPF